MTAAAGAFNGYRLDNRVASIARACEAFHTKKL
jgi:hypothetical protein